MIIRVIYEFILEYAISCKAHSFIEDMLLKDTIMQNINNSVLLEYAKTRDADFYCSAIAALANITYNRFSKHSSSPTIQESFESSAKDLFRDSRLQKIPDLIKIVLSNPKITSDNKWPFLKSLFDAYIRQSEQETTTETFLNCLPKDIDEHNKIKLLATIINTFSYWPVEQIPVLDRLLQYYSFNSSQIAEILKSADWFGKALPYLNKLLQQLKTCHPEYQTYQLISEFLALDLKARAKFILEHPGILAIEIQGRYGKYELIHRLDISTLVSLIDWYITHPDYKEGELLSSHVMWCDEDVVIRYLECPHSIINSGLLRFCLERNRKTRAKLIELILARGYTITENDINFASLLDLFHQSDNNSIKILLAHPFVYDRLKNYYQLKGDMDLSLQEHGSLLPMVVAWYLNSQDKAKAEEIFFSIPESKRENLLNNSVPNFIDVDESILRVYISKKGTSQMIDAIGGVYPRLMDFQSGPKPIAFIPAFWKNPGPFKFVSQTQQKSAVKLAQKSFVHYGWLRNATDEITSWAKLIVGVHKPSSLFLQHETTFENAKSILQNGSLKTRQRIQGHSSEGKASKGLINSERPTKSPGSDFVYFTRRPTVGERDSLTIHYSGKPRQEQALFLFNAQQLFEENPQISFTLIGSYPFFANTKSLTCLDGVTIKSDPRTLEEGTDMMKIELNGNNKLSTIYQKLLEFALIKHADQIPQDKQRSLEVARGLVDLLHLEWMVPGEVPLRLSYVEEIEFNGKSYDLRELRQTALVAEESEVLAAIHTFTNIEQFPFVIKGLLNIACQRKQMTAIKLLLECLKKVSVDNNTVYYPHEVYQIESLAQLLLEDMDNNRVYAHYSGKALTLKAALKVNSNRSGAHHAEIAKLHYALGVGDLQGQNALGIRLGHTLTLAIGDDASFKNLAALRDALLTYEVTTLLTSRQNITYYKESNGGFHPVTGKGATNGKVALLSDRLFSNEEPYHIQVRYVEKESQISICVDKQNLTQNVADTLRNVLTIPEKDIMFDRSEIRITLPITDFIEKLRHSAIFYEGVNVITEDGRLLLARRSGKGLASPGGHHSDKYSPESIGYGLKSEFGLEFKNPAQIEKDVIRLSIVKIITKKDKKIVSVETKLIPTTQAQELAKKWDENVAYRVDSTTGIYIVSHTKLVPTPEAQDYAKLCEMDVEFRADKDEFDHASEIALTTIQMRGKRFYDVMPIAELCQYQLQQLKDYLKTHFPTDYDGVTLTIDNRVDYILVDKMHYKIPTDTFGQITISVNAKVSPELTGILESRGKLVSESNSSTQVYVLDISPYEITQLIDDKKSVASCKV